MTIRETGISAQSIKLQMGLAAIRTGFHKLSGLIQYSPVQEMNRRENGIIYQTMKLILGED